MSVYQEVINHLSKPDSVVALTTHYRITYFYPKHIGMFVKPTKESELDKGVYIKRGKNHDFAMGYQLKFGKVVKNK